MLPFLSPAPGQEGVGTVRGLDGVVCPGSHDWGHAVRCALLEFLQIKALNVATDAIHLGKDHPRMVKPLHKGCPEQDGHRVSRYYPR